MWLFVTTVSPLEVDGEDVCACKWATAGRPSPFGPVFMAFPTRLPRFVANLGVIQLSSERSPYILFFYLQHRSLYWLFASYHTTEGGVVWNCL